MHADGVQGLDDVSERIIGAAYRVQNALGCGFLEKVYENALAWELRSNGAKVDRQVAYEVRYRGSVVGCYVADLVVCGAVIVEVKACPALTSRHCAQSLNYLKASGLPLALLLNFGNPKVEVRRLAHRFSPMQTHKSGMHADAHG